ncbi:MAG TPA: hypothetical protein VL907_11675 [Pyrinomonadaceae bacterium]|jgi:hypothetical protein|nr:hypothetical protein [Pyrinomonadaceae bacterium]
MRLEAVGKLVAGHNSTPLPERRSGKSELEQEILRRMFTWMTWGIIILGIGVVMLVFNKSFSIGNWLRFLSTMVCLSGVGVATAGLLSAIRQGVSGKRPVDQISGSVDTKSLASKAMPASLPSVTEQTTQLLSTEEAPDKLLDSNPRE